MLSTRRHELERFYEGDLYSRFKTLSQDTIFTLIYSQAINWQYHSWIILNWYHEFKAHTTITEHTTNSIRFYEQFTMILDETTTRLTGPKPPPPDKNLGWSLRFRGLPCWCGVWEVERRHGSCKTWLLQGWQRYWGRRVRHEVEGERGPEE